MTKRWIAITSFLILIAAVGGALALAQHDPVGQKTPPVTAAPISSQQSDDKNVDIDQNSGTKEVTKTGVMACLQPSQEATTQSTSCALGLNADDGKIYALQADDPMLIGSIPTNSRVRVTGALIKQSNSYNAEGIIKVQTVKRL